MNRSSACPACGSQNNAALPVWQIESAPIHSCRLFSDSNSARTITRRPIELICCDHCALVFNRQFDESTQQFESRYEETQMYSDHFSAFARDLACQIGEKYTLDGKRVLEVGCGKGQFLALLAEQTGCEALGVDPSYAPDRCPAPDNARLNFMPETLRSTHAAFNPDLLIHRHTLEHIDNIYGFLHLCRSMGNHPGDAGDSLKHVIEVPALERIIDEGAFWDIYYEHANYFSCASLTTALDAAGYSEVSTIKVFHDQYLLAHAVSGAATEPNIEFADRPEKTAARLSVQIGRMIRRWTDVLDRWQYNGQRAVLWGGGSKAVAFLDTLALDDKVIEAAIDINPHKQGCFLPGTGHPVWAPESLIVSPVDHIVVMNPVYRPEIENQCQQLGIEARLIAVDQPPD